MPCTPGHPYLPHLGAPSCSNAPEMQCGTFLWCLFSAWAMQCHTGATVLQNQQSQPLLLSLSVTKHTELIGNFSKPSKAWKMKHLECTQATSSIPEETLQEETSDVRRPENRLVPSPRIKHQPEGLNFLWKHYPALIWLIRHAVAPAPVHGTVIPVAAPSQEEVLQGGGHTPLLSTFVSLTLWGLIFLWNLSCVDGYICWVPPVSPGLRLPCLEVLWGRGVWSLRALLLPEEGIFGPINQRQAGVGPAYLGCVNKLHFLGDWPSITLCHTPLIRGGHERSSLRWKKNNIIGPPHACTIPDLWGWQDIPSLC